MTRMTSLFGQTRVTVVVATLSLVVLTSPGMSQAQETNITPSGLNTATHSDGAMTIFIDGGTRPGTDSARPNLFHSFGDFSIGENVTALFRNLGATGAPGTGYSGTTDNIIGRVTGNKPSILFGTLDTISHFPTANFFLVNPNGMVFGADSTINVGGSANFVAADYLRMADALFYADPDLQTDTLRIAAVNSFGFLAGNPLGTIRVEGGTIKNTSALTLVGRDIVDSSGKTTKPGIAVTGGTLSNPGGGINLISVKTPQDTVAGGEILVGDMSPASGNGFSALGTVQLDSGGTLKTTSTTGDAGSIFVRAGNFVMDHAGIDSRTIPTFDLTRGRGVGGDVDIHASTVRLTGGVSTAELWTGKALGMTTIVTNNTADITINALNVTLDNAVLRTDIDQNGGFGIFDLGVGDIHIQGINGSTSLASQVAIVNNSRVEALGRFDDPGSVLGGNVSVRADEITLGTSDIHNDMGKGINLYGNDGIFSLGNNTIQSKADGVPSGPISIGSAGKVELRTGDTIVSETERNFFDPSGDPLGPGDITINAPLIDIRGTSITSRGSPFVVIGDINLLGDSIHVKESTFIVSTQSPGEIDFGGTFGFSTAGDSQIAGFNAGTNAQAIELINSHLKSELIPSGDSPIGARGHVGNIVLKGHAITLDGTDVSVNHPGAGESGSIRVDGGQFRMLNGSVLTSSTSGLDTENESGEPVAAAPGGNIAVTATGRVDITTASSIRSTSSGDGKAGPINLRAGNDLLVRNSTVTTFAAQASGGNIKLTAPNLVRIVDSTITSSVQGPAGSDGGNINIDPLLVVIQTSQLLAKANAGTGGAIDIAASGAVLVDPTSKIDASAGPAGVPGRININAPIQVLSGALVPLNLVYSQAGLSGDRCAADPKGQFSSFVQTGRDGVPQVPGALSPSPLSFLETLTSGSLGSQFPSLAAARLGLNFVSVDDSTLFRFHSACRS